MKKCLFILLLVYGAANAQVKHVILISIDGLHPDMYLDKNWPSNNLGELAKQGTYADHMKSVFPSYTYPSHTAMLTGAYPARSGIYFNQPKNDYSGNWNWFASAIRVPTLWQVLKQNGLTTAAVEWPVSVTKDISYDVPEIWSDKYPDRITVPRQYATPGLIDSIEKYATGKLDSNNMSEDYYSMDANSGKMAAYIFKTYKPAFLAVHFAEVDGYEHQYGRDADSVRIALEEVDQAIGMLVQEIKRTKAGDSTAIIIVGDHGFSTFHTVFRVNMLIPAVQAKFITSGGSAFLYRYRTTKESDMSGIVKAVTDSLNKLPKDKRNLFRIINRKELDKMGADSSALLALSANNGSGLVFSGSTAAAKPTNQGPGTSIQNNPLDGVFISQFGGHHGYDPNNPEMYTGFIAYGAGINKGGHIRELTVTDIVPLIAKLLGVAFKAPDGKLVDGILQH